MKINIIGASGSGTTTLAGNLAQMFNYIHLDSDKYFWKDTEKQFEHATDSMERNRLLKEDLERFENDILSGPIFHWGENLTNYFNLVVFLYVPHNIRMKRLQLREYARYGSLIETDAQTKYSYNDFMDFAARYDDPQFDNTRTFHAQQNWLSSLDIPVIRIEGDYTLEENMTLVVDEIKKIKIGI